MSAASSSSRRNKKRPDRRTQRTAAGPAPTRTQPATAGEPRRTVWRKVGAYVWPSGSWRADNARFLHVALTVSVLVHAVVLAMHFTAPTKKPPAREASLEVILVNAGTKAKPVKADALAQVNSDGGGSHESGRSKSPLERSRDNAPGEVLGSAQQRQAALEAQQRLLAAQLESQRKNLTPPPAESGPNTLPSPQLPVDAQTRARQLTRQFAEISNRIEEYNKRPRKHFFAPSTSEYRYATYVEQWRSRVETVGNRNYPPEARGRVYGSLRMTVLIRADGSIESVTIDRPSEHKILNDAARRIIALSAPFPPFPPQIAKDTDILAITRTWHFTNDTLTAAPG